MIKLKKGSKLRSVAATAVALTVGVSSMGLTAFADEPGLPPAPPTQDASYAGKYYTDYETMEDAKKAAEELTRELAQEGDVLLKNQDGALPLRGNEWVSVFGVRSDNMVGASDSAGAFNSDSGANDSTLADALTHAGFNVNPTLKSYYDNDSSAIGKEDTTFNGQVKNSFALYNDVAFIVLSREGGEGSDAARVTTETVGADDTHKALLAETKKTGEGENATETPTGKKYKHSLMLTDSEIQLIAQVKQQFKKIVVITNTSNPIEMGDLQNDPQINAIIHIGRPGVGGLNGLADILKGTVSPSGGLVDEWMTDFTADPTWYNFGNNNQTKGYGTGNAVAAGSTAYLNEDGTKTGKADKVAGTEYEGDEGYYGVDYEESIYLGYKYYETVYTEIATGGLAYDPATKTLAKTGNTDNKVQNANAWWEANVTYPFGYGLSYTTFSFKADKIYTDAALTAELGDTVAASVFNSALNAPAQVKKLYVPVTVKNTGDVAGKKTVQAYVTAPYTAGGIEKSAVTLVGFAKTDIIAPGGSQKVVVELNVQDMASWDYKDANGDNVKGDYELDAGEYTLRLMEDSHYDYATDVSDTTDAYDEVKFNLSETAHLKLDDFSDKELKNLFTTGDNDETTDWSDVKEDDLNYGNIRTGNMMADGTSGMTLLSRNDMVGTFPKAPTTADLTFKNKVLKNWAYWDNYQVSDNPQIDSNSGLPSGQYRKDGDYSLAKTDKADYPWYVEASEIPATWTQATGVYDEHHKVQNNRTELEFPMYVSKAEESPIKFKDMYGVDYEDAKWDQFLNQLTYDELCSVVEFGGYSTVDIASVGKVKTEDSDGPNNWDSSHCWCSADLISSTYNVKLAEKQGRLMGNIGLLKDGGSTSSKTQVGWYGPGADIHRSPFSGRNNEYYSQDGLQGGYMVAAVIQGAQSKGIVCYVKHCFMNDQETNRGNLFTWADEQTVRENGCKMFQMALQEGGSKAAMVAYGRLGGLSNTNNYNMNTELYQNQWATKAYFVTDGYIGWVIRTSPDMMVRAGNLMELYTTPFVEFLSGEWNATKNNGKGMVMVGQTLPEQPKEQPGGQGGQGGQGGETPQGPAPQADEQAQLVESPTQWYCVRKAAHAILYQLADTAAQRNGYSELTVSNKTLAAGLQGVKYEGSVAIDSLLDKDSFATLTVKGNVPAGLKVDSLTGAISGTPTATGEYTFTVDYKIDGYISKSANYTLKINSALTLAQDGDALDAAKVGEEFMTQIVSTEFTADKYDKIVYAVKSGALPAGLTLAADGTIEGTPTTAGVYNVVIEMTAEKTSQSGGGSKAMAAFNGTMSAPSRNGNKGGSQKETTKVEIALTFVVTGEGGTITDWKENVPYIGDNGNWFVNGVDTGTSARGEKGEPGEKGETGEAGVAGIAGEGGCGGVIGATSAVVAALATLGGAALVLRKKKEDD